MQLSKQDIAIVGLRLLAIYVALQVIDSLPMWLSTLSIIYRQPNDFSIIFILFSGFLPLFTIAIPILLWLFSIKISKSIIKFSSTLERVNVHNNTEFRSTIFCAAGIVIFVQFFPEFVIYLYKIILVLVKNNGRFFLPYRLFYPFIQVNIKLLLSLLLIFKANNLSRLTIK